MGCIWGVRESPVIEMGHPDDKSSGGRTEK